MANVDGSIFLGQLLAALFITPREFGEIKSLDFNHTFHFQGKNKLQNNSSALFTYLVIRYRSLDKSHSITTSKDT